jgi:hypothetical protein
LSSAGVISGVPSEVGTFGFTVKVTDGQNEMATRSLSLIVNPDIPLSAGLLAGWSFDESSGSTANDLTGSHPGTLMNGPVWLPNAGQINGALKFDGEDDYVDIGNMDIASGSGISIAFWFKADDFGAADARFISKATGISDEDHYWMVSSYNGSALRFRLKTAGSTSTLVTDQGQVQAGTWFHVAITYDGSQMRIYKNSVEVASTAKSGSIDTNNNVKTAIGNQPSGAGNQPFDGLLDEVRIYNRALSASDIDSLYNSGIDENPGGGHPLPTGYQLRQNYPNPFNPSTTISFNMARQGYVKLYIYNVLGQLVERLVDTVVPGGLHQVLWTPRGIPSGEYYYVMKAGNFNATKIMQLVN